MFFTDDDGRDIIFKEPVSNRAIKNHVIRSERVPNEGTCRVLCYMEPNCVSINLGPLEGETHKCELNNATDESQFFTFLKNEPRYTYLAIEVTVKVKFLNFTFMIQFTSLLSITAAFLTGLSLIVFGQKTFLSSNKAQVFLAVSAFNNWGVLHDVIQIQTT